ncbi:hypothetical protein ANO11243_070070 [Dothideomycetidae sp. 11243]|nr:hypothetical protein ANO11243_070070 [fungal sp. No.11243]
MSAYEPDENAPLLPHKSTPHDTASCPPVTSLDESPKYQTIAQDGSNHEPQETEIGGSSKFLNISNRNFYLVFIVLLLCVVVGCFEMTFMASAHPIITSYFKVSNAASWLTTVFMISLAASQPLVGRLSDTIGRRPVFIVALLAFTLATIWCALAGNIGSFIAARALCGVGAGAAYAMSMIILSDCVPIELRGMYQSYLNLAFGIGTFSGATLGGLLCDTLGWRWAFGVQVPFLALSVVLAYCFVPQKLGPMFKDAGEGGSWDLLKNFDYKGSVLLIIGVTTLVSGLNLGGNVFPWRSAQVITCFAIFAIACPALIYNETKATSPLILLRLLRKSPVSNMIYLNLFTTMSTLTVYFNIPLFFQAVKLASASEAGLQLALPSTIASVAGVASGFVITYTKQTKPTLLIGACLAIAGSTAICFLTRDVSNILAIVLITGVPIGFTGMVAPSSLIGALAASEQIDQANVTTTLGLFRNIGNILGIAISSLVFQNALIVQLDRSVTGPDKLDIIRRVRRSVQAVKTLEGQAQDQVIDAYLGSLQASFLVAVAGSLCVLLLAAPARLPRLGQKKQDVEDVDES